MSNYRLVSVGQSSPDAVTVGIEGTGDRVLKAAVWWESKGDVDADEAEYDDVIDAFAAAETARALHGFDEVVVVLSQPDLWDDAWGKLQLPPVAREPIGDLQEAELSSDEAFGLAQAIEAERDA